PLLRAVAAHLSEGTDTLRNIEQLQFSDMTIPVPVFVATAIVPNVIGLIDTAAAAAITAVGLQVGATTGIETTTVPVGTVLGQFPAGGTTLVVGRRVNLEVAVAPVAFVRNVFGRTPAAAHASDKARG